MQELYFVLKVRRIDKLNNHALLLLVWIEVFFQAFPTLVVLFVHLLARILTPFGQSKA